MNKSKKHNCDVISTTSDHERIITALKSEIERLNLVFMDVNMQCQKSRSIVLMMPYVIGKKQLKHMGIGMVTNGMLFWRENNVD